MKKTVCLLSLCLLSACGGGGGGGGEASSPVAVSPSPSAPPSATTPAPSAPAATPAVPLASSYATTDMSCVQGDPAYWQRPWRIDYAGGGFRLQPLPPTSSDVAPVQAEPVQVIAWDPTRVVSSPADDGTHYSAETSDGRRASLRVAPDGTPVGFAVQDGSGAPLRCGTLAAGAIMAAPQTTNLLCQWQFPADGPISTPPDIPAFVASVTLDRSVFPWASLVVTSDPPLISDPSGDEIAHSASRYWNIVSDGSLSVYIGPVFTAEGTYYSLRNGAVVGAHVPSSTAWGPLRNCTPM